MEYGILHGVAAVARELEGAVAQIGQTGGQLLVILSVYIWMFELDGSGPLGG